MESIKERHAKIREEAAQKLYELYHNAVLADVEHQKNKPDLLKEIDDTLDTHVFKKLFT